jgi:hypothetical protein
MREVPALHSGTESAAHPGGTGSESGGGQGRRRGGAVELQKPPGPDVQFSLNAGGSHRLGLLMRC